MKPEDLNAISEMMNTDPGNTLIRFLIDQNAQNTMQAAYHQGMADAFEVIHKLLNGDVQEPNAENATKEA